MGYLMKSLVISTICQMFNFTVTYSTVLIIFLLINDSLFAGNLVHLPSLFFSFRLLSELSLILLVLTNAYAHYGTFSSLNSLSHIISPNFVRFCVCACVCMCLLFLVCWFVLSAEV